MGYKIDKSESINTGIKRVIIEQIDSSIESINQLNGNEHDVIHDIRKRGKKIRGALRFVRDALGKKRYQKENAFFRDLTGELSDLRDATSMISAVEALHPGNERESNSKAHFIALFTRKRSKLFEEHYSPEKLLDIRKQLIEAKERYIYMKMPAHGFEDIEKSIKRVYKRGYKAFDQAYEEPTVEGFHEWRKRVKYLWYHYRLLKTIWPGIFKAYASESKLLSDYLGDDHDYAVLLENLKNGYVEDFQQEQAEDILNMAQNQKKKLLKEAFPLGEKIYASKTKTFVHHIHQLWEVWSDQALKKKINIPQMIQ